MKTMYLILIGILIISSALTYGSSHQQLAPPGKNECAVTDRIRYISYLIDTIRTKQGDDLLAQINDSQKARITFRKLFPLSRLGIQSSRHIDKKACTGRCWFCLLSKNSLLSRRQTIPPMSLDEITGVLEELIPFFDTIIFYGDDTLDDVESLLTCASIYRDMPNKRIAIFTHGLQFLMGEVNPEVFFKQLRDAVGSIAGVDLIISIDQEKLMRPRVQRYFKSNVGREYQTLGNILHTFRTYFIQPAKYTSSVALFSHAFPQSSQSGKPAAQQFKKNIQHAIREQYPDIYRKEESTEFFSVNYTPIELNTLVSIVHALQEGTLDAPASVHDLLSDASATKKFRMNTPLFDVSTGEIATEANIFEMWRRPVTSKTALEVLLASFINPVTTHFVTGSPEQKEAAAQRFYDYAALVDPLLSQKPAQTPRAILHYISGNLELLTNIELLFLIEDLLQYKKTSLPFTYIPKQLAPELTNARLIQIVLQYFRDHEHSEHTQSTSFIDDYRSDPVGAVARVQAYLENILFPALIESDILQLDNAGTAPRKYLKAVVYKDFKEDALINRINELSKSH